MAFRFRRSLKIAPGLRVNIGKRGASISTGVRGASITVGKRGTYGNIGIPGTGLSYRSRVDGRSEERRLEREQRRIDKEHQRIEKELKRREALSKVKLSLNENGSINFENAFGEPLSRSDLQILWSKKRQTLIEWLEQQAEKINGDVELLSRIFEDTPSPDLEPEYQILSFDEPPPSKPLPLKPTIEPKPTVLPSLGFFQKRFKAK